MMSTATAAVPSLLPSRTAALAAATGVTPLLTRNASETGAASGGSKTVALGRNGWAMATDAEGRTYYFHTKTGSTQWQRPIDY